MKTETSALVRAALCSGAYGRSVFARGRGAAACDGRHVDRCGSSHTHARTLFLKPFHSQFLHSIVMMLALIAAWWVVSSHIWLSLFAASAAALTFAFPAWTTTLSVAIGVPILYSLIRHHMVLAFFAFVLSIAIYAFAAEDKKERLHSATARLTAQLSRNADVAAANVRRVTNKMTAGFRKEVNSASAAATESTRAT